MGLKKKEKGNFARNIVKNLFFGGLTGVIAKIGALIFTVLIARNFLPELFGVYSLALTIVLSLFIISDLGLGNTLVRYLAESIGKKDKKQARSRFWFLLKSKALLSLIVALFLFFGAGLISSFFGKPELILLLKIGSIYLFASAFYQLTINVFFSFQKMEYSTILELIFQTSRVVLLFVVFSFFKSIESIFVVLTLSVIPALIFSTGILIKKYPFLLKGKKEVVERRRMLKFSGFMALSSFTVLIFTNIDKLVLGYFLTSEFIGFYTAILTVIGGVLGFMGVTSILFPIFTQLKGERLKKAFKQSFHYISILIFPVVIGLAFIILPLLKVLYGSEYVPQQYEFSLLLTSIFLSLILLETTFSALYTHLLNAKEKPRISAFINLTTSIANIILSIIFVYYLIKINPSYGLIGVSAATFISRYSGMFVMVFLSKKKIGIAPRKDSIFKPLFASLIMLAYLFVFNYFIPLNIFTGLIMIFSAAIIYFSIIFLLKAITISEVKRMFRMIGNNDKVID